ncbi:type II secretion system F family protein [Citrifermentans bremense]|uniref:type II secretion system F family protein n=1 Tax=Citrifermentans bremense TaxID=60035 RepID=UPI0004050BC4|nr:type II secretion system F family protein [Citrifermentans bremense]
MTATLLLIFVAVFLGTFSLFSVLTRARHSNRLRHRLRKMGDGASSGTADSKHVLLPETTAAERFLARLPLAAFLKRQVSLSGVNISTLGFLLVTGSISALGFIVLFAWKENVFLSLLAALALAASPFAYLDYRRKKRLKLFAEQLPDALVMVARSLRAGHSLAAAVELISLELPEPSGGYFKLAYEQQKLGVRIADSLISLRERVDSQDFNFFLTVVRINSESGGNLSEILDKLAETIRSRLQIRRQVDVITAEGRISGYVLVALPVVMFAGLYLLRPGYLDVFFTQRLCQLILGAAVLGQVVGFFIIRKIVNIAI